MGAEINDVKSRSTFAKILHEKLFDLEYGDVNVCFVEVIDGHVAMDGEIAVEGFRKFKFTCIQSVQDLRRLIEEYHEDEN